MGNSDGSGRVRRAEGWDAGHGDAQAEHAVKRHPGFCREGMVR